MRSLKRAAVLAALAAVLVCASPALAAGRPCVSQNLMPAFDTFMAKMKGRTPQEHAKAFLTDFAPRYPEYYAPKVYGDAAKLEKSSLKLFDPAQRPSFEGLAPLDDARFQAVGDSIGAAFAAAQAGFLKMFPDFQCRTYVAFGPSFFRFDGHTYDAADGQARLLFGIDMIAMMHGPEDLNTFFDHELFHLYFDQVGPGSWPKGELVWGALWNEGLATYVSQRMNPAFSAQGVLWFPRDLVARVQPQLARAAQLLLADLDKDDEATYGHWFLASTGTNGLPPRTGYYLGYLFAQEMAKDNSLSALARIEPQIVHARAKAFLVRLAAQK